jgi:hypothetical protein
MTALVGVAADLRAVFAAHVPFQLVDRCGFRPADDIQRHGLVGVATEASDFKVEISRVESIAQRRGGLCRSFVSKHTLVPGLAGELIGNLSRFLGSLSRMPDRTAIDALARLRAHQARMRQRGFDRQAATDWARNRLNRCRSWMLISRTNDSTPNLPN